MARLSIITRVMYVRYQTSQAFVTGSCPFFDCTYQLFTDHRMSGLPNRAKYKHCLIQILKAHFRQFSHRPISPSTKWWSPRHGVQTLHSCWIFFFARSQYRSTHFFAWPSMSQDHAIGYACDFPNRVNFTCSGRDSWIEHFSVFINNSFVRFALTLSASQVHVVKKSCRSSQVNQFHPFSSTSDWSFAFFQHFIWHPRLQIVLVLFSRLTKKRSQFGTFSLPCSNGTFSNCLFPW